MSRPSRCPTCNAPCAQRFPATAFEGEALGCPDVWHLTDPQHPPTETMRSLVERGRKNPAPTQPSLSAEDRGRLEERVCERPPNGWRCTRPGGHEGPCAAVPIAEEYDAFARPAHGQVWIDKQSGYTVGVLNVSGDGPIVSGHWHRSLNPDDAFAFSLSEFTDRFLPLAVDPSCIPNVLSTEEATAIVSAAFGEDHDSKISEAVLKRLGDWVDAELQAEETSAQPPASTEGSE